MTTNRLGFSFLADSTLAIVGPHPNLLGFSDVEPCEIFLEKLISTRRVSSGRADSRYWLPPEP